MVKSSVSLLLALSVAGAYAAGGGRGRPAVEERTKGSDTLTAPDGLESLKANTIKPPAAQEAPSTALNEKEMSDLIKADLGIEGRGASFRRDYIRDGRILAAIEIRVIQGRSGIERQMFLYTPEMEAKQVERFRDVIRNDMRNDDYNDAGLFIKNTTITKLDEDRYTGFSRKFKVTHGKVVQGKRGGELDPMRSYDIKILFESLDAHIRLRVTGAVPNDTLDSRGTTLGDDGLTF